MAQIKQIKIGVFLIALMLVIGVIWYANWSHGSVYQELIEIASNLVWSGYIQF